MDANTVLKSLKWRYATKIFDKTRIIPDTTMNALIESMRLSPSSLGLQPWKFLIIDNEDVRKNIRAVGHDQPQLTDASHLVVFCRREDVNEKYVNAHVAEMANVREIPVESLDGYKKMVLSFLASLSPIMYEVWTSKQVYIALGFLLSTAASLSIDACPMEGFNAKKVDEILRLKEKNLSATVMCPLGYRSSDDKYSSLKKVRFPLDKVVETIK